MSLTRPSRNVGRDLCVLADLCPQRKSIVKCFVTSVLCLFPIRDMHDLYIFDDLTLGLVRLEQDRMGLNCFLFKFNLKEV